MPRRYALAVIWIAFLIRGVYYCVQQPLWEGLDEWANFAALQHFATHGHMPARTDPVSDEVVRSLELAPLAHGTAQWVAGAADHDTYWQLSAAERARCSGELQLPDRAISPARRIGRRHPSFNMKDSSRRSTPPCSRCLTLPRSTGRSFSRYCGCAS